MREPSVFLSSLTLEIWGNFSVRFKHEKGKASYYTDINLLCDFLEKDFLKITKIDSEKYFNYLREKVRKQETKPSTVIKKMRELSKFSDYIIDNTEKYGIKFENLFEVYLLSLKETEKIEYVPSIGEIDRLLICAKRDFMYYTIISLVYRTGMKPSEIYRLKMSDIICDINAMYIKVQKHNKNRVVYVPKDMQIILEQYLENRNRIDIDYVFYNSQNNPLNERYLERMMNHLTDAAGLEPFTLYDVRNASAALMFVYGAKPHQVAETLGISELGIQRYNDVLFDYDVSKFANALTKIKIELPNQP